jgi:hypothetical protein
MLVNAYTDNIISLGKELAWPGQRPAGQRRRRYFSCRDAYSISTFSMKFVRLR